MFKTPRKLKKITILGKEIPVILDDNLCNEHSAMGLYLLGNIVLRKEYPSQIDFVDTFSHECFHAMCGILGAQLDQTVEEILANTMGTMNIQIINKLFSVGAFDTNKVVTVDDSE